MAERKPWEEMIDGDRIIYLHHEALKRHGGASGPADPSGCVEGALGAAYNAELYLEEQQHAVPGLSFAGHLLVYLVRRHCFVDGNKRVAWAAAIDVLDGFGLSVDASDDEAESFVDDVLQNVVESGVNAAGWLALRIRSAN